MDLNNTLLDNQEKDIHKIVLSDVSIYNHNVQKPLTADFKVNKTDKIDSTIKQKCDSFYDEFLLNAELLKKQLDNTIESLKLTTK